MIKDENFVTIQGWMLKLPIKGNALIAFACIYGFSQDNETEFTGSAQYIADWCGITRTAAFDVLKTLVEKDLIIKTDIIKNKVKLCNYKQNFEGIKKLIHPTQETCTGGYQETCHHIISSYNNNKIDKPEIKKISNDVYVEIEEKYIESFKKVIPNGEPIIDYGAVRKRIKSVLLKLPKEKILSAIERAKSDKWLIENGFSLMTILGEYQLNKLLNGFMASSSPFGKSSAPVVELKCKKCGTVLTNGFCTNCGANYDRNGEPLCI
jgi:hypothetical protein